MNDQDTNVDKQPDREMRASGFLAEYNELCKKWGCSLKAEIINESITFANGDIGNIQKPRTWIQVSDEKQTA